MKNRGIKFLPLVFLVQLLFLNLKGQDVTNLSFQGNQSAEINPKNILIREGKSYIVYNKANPSDPANPFIGLSKIDNSTNQVLFDVTYNLSTNTSYWASHFISVVDIEMLGNNLYVLASIDSKDILLLTIDKMTSSIIQKQIIYSGAGIFFPSDLLFGRSEDDGDPYITIMGKSTTYPDNNDYLLLFYKKISEPNFTRITIGYPYGAGFRSNFKNCRISGFYKGPGTPNRAILSYLSGGQAGSFEINLVDNSRTAMWDYEAFNLPGQYTARVRAFNFFFWDGIPIYYGQFTNDNNTLNGDFFYYYGEDLITFNNPNFYMISGDAHPNDEGSPSVVSGGFYTSPVNAFQGIYYDPADPLHPKYALGYLNVQNYSNPITCSSYTLRNNAVGTTNLSDFFGAITGAGPWAVPQSTTNISAFLYRKPVATSDASNAYFMNQMNGFACTSTIPFVNTTGSYRVAYMDTRPNNLGFQNPFRENGLIINPYFTIRSVDQTAPADFEVYSFSNNVGVLSSVCQEPLTNSIHPPLGDPADPYWDPECSCYRYPPLSINAKKAATYTDKSIEDRNTQLVTISPNPVSDQLTIRAESPIRHIEIFDGAGRSVLRKSSGQNLVIVPVGQLAGGSYIVKVILADGKLSTQKIIKLQK